MKSKLGDISAYSILMIVSIVMLIPFAWMVLTAFKTPQQVFSETMQIFPSQLNLDNFREVMTVAPFPWYMFNTIVVVTGIAVMQVAVVIPAAYAFARLRFWGMNVVFVLYIVQIMLPLEAIVVPNYFVIKSLGLLNTRIAMMLPFIGSGYGTFLIRQAFKQVPSALEDAAKIDGCGHLRIIRHVMVPLSMPVILTFIFISVVTHWNDYFWPMIITDVDAVRTLTVGLGMFVQQEAGADWTLLMAATLFVCAPVMAAFLIFQRAIIQNFMYSGIKG